MEEEIITRGAEAVLIRQGNKLVKRRISKGYRLKEIDEKLRLRRTRQEARLLAKATGMVAVPRVLAVDEKKKELVMEYIGGKKLSEHLDSMPLEKARMLCKKIGESIAKLHDANIIHGDLTTSNMIYVEKEDKVYFIDFGLGFHSTRIEDKAVDLHLLKQALEAKHFAHWQELFNAVIDGYSISENSAKVLERLEKVEKRGRYKHK